MTWHNLGICCYYVDNLPAALDCFTRVRRSHPSSACLRACKALTTRFYDLQSMELDPHYADARSWYRKVRTHRVRVLLCVVTPEVVWPSPGIASARESVNSRSVRKVDQVATRSR